MKPSKRNNGDKDGIVRVPVFRNFFDSFWNADPFFSDDMLKFRGGDLPAVNIIEKDSSFEIEVAAPGFDKKDFELTIENGILTISAEKEATETEKDGEYTRKEFSYASFKRSFTLPDNIDKRAVDATYVDGVLKLSLLKKAVDIPISKKIMVQ